MTGPEGNSEFCLRETLNVSRGEAGGNTEVKCFVIPPNSKLEKTAKKSLAFCRQAHKFAAVLRSTTWSRASRKFMLLFP